MKKTEKLKNIKNLIEHNGDFFTPEELAEHLKVDGEFEIVLHDEDDTWFGKAMKKLKEYN